MAIHEHRDVENGLDDHRHELQKPFIQHPKSVDSDEETTNENGSIGMVLLSTCVAVCGSFEFGSCVGYSSPTQSAIRQDLNLSISQFSMFGSIITIGAMFGAITSGRIADFIGRKGAMRLSAAFCITGWLAVYLSNEAWSLDVGRFCTGFGIGIFSFVVPVFIAEIAPKNLRGGLATLNQLMIVCGSSIAYILGTVVTWRALALTGFSSGKVGTIAYAIIQVPITVLGAMLMDKSGRRPLLTVSATGMFLGCILTGASFFFKVYIATFSIGMGPVPWVIMSEIFPIHVKGVAGSLVVLVNWLGAWAVSYTFNFLMSWSSTGTFLMYAGFSALTVVFVAKTVPETKGKTLEEIQASINS
ncbi:UNVERIFIED_CONTAM: Sugar transporter ERD6-like 16 [Sesamum radiatum]|uniref:Sugar transporter ERD6-like 16 n=1 Tax=Sesamum radiatum TaxID=300843 RepID=A0AAW2UEF6_SESRA